MHTCLFCVWNWLTKQQFRPQPENLVQMNRYLERVLRRSCILKGKGKTQPISPGFTSGVVISYQIASSASALCHWIVDEIREKILSRFLYDICGQNTRTDGSTLDDNQERNYKMFTYRKWMRPSHVGKRPVLFSRFATSLILVFDNWLLGRKKCRL